jgi:molecular chaperone GrpE
MSNNPDNFDQVLPPADGPNGVDSNAAPDASSQLSKAEAEAAEFKVAWLRAKAETDNVRKQGQNDVAKAYKYAIERFAQELLTVKDALELTLATPSATIQTLHDGVELTLKNLQAAFDKAQLSEINPLNEKYDPHRHQAMTMLESDQPPGTVVQVFQKGYLLNDRVLRPALVAVAKAREGAASGPAGA